MENTEVKEVVPEVVAEEASVAEAPKPEVMKIVTGEIHIIADEKGGISLKYPQNKIVAFGLLEAAKEIIISQSIQAHAPKEPLIKRAGADALAHLGRKPS